MKLLLLICLTVFSAQGWAKGANLTQKTAIERASKISDVNYNMSFELTKDKGFSGTTTVDFNLSRTNKDIPLDFYEATVLSLTVNGKKVKANYNGKVILLSRKDLKKGANSVMVSYKRNYNTNGHGLTISKDPADGRTYMYTQFETMYANYVFPCFDQPDLKAHYTMQVTAPKNWEVITSTRESKTEKLNNKRKKWHFPKSAKFSTYLISLHAGPFKIWKSKAGKIPLRLYARKSLAKNVKHKEWFDTTIKGFKYFQKVFGYDYPYIKYDQVIVPEFRSGAMENVAAVTFREGFVSRGKKSRAEKRRLANVILHEMAHMWFGNLVTMKWWNDLWLNESFATYMANKAMDEATDFNEAWESFFARTKQWAYWEDQLVTTHPIEAKVPDVQQASANFDGITYGKGASVLKQLNYYIGNKAYEAGLKTYFKKFATKNTLRKDFVGELSASYGKSLDKWQKKWLATAGVNKIKVTPQCEGSSLKTLTVKQYRDEAASIYRPHRFEVALLNTKSNKVAVSKTISVETSRAKKVIKLAAGTKCPDLIYPNYKDYGYIQLQLDDKTLSNLETKIAMIEDDFLRGMFWTSLWGMVRKGDLSIYKYSDLLTKIGVNETNNDILSKLAENMYSVLYYLPRYSASEKIKRNQILGQFEVIAWNKLNLAKRGSEQQRTWYDLYVGMADSEEGFNNMKRILDGRLKFKGFKVDQDRRWKLVTSLVKYDAAEADKYLAKEIKRDNSHRAKTVQATIEAARPTWENKLKILNKLKKGPEMSLDMIRATVRGIFPYSQYKFSERYAASYYSDLAGMLKTKDPNFIRAYTSIQPRECHTGYKGRAKKFLRKNKKKLTPRVKKAVRIRIQEDERCRTILKKARAS